MHRTPRLLSLDLRRLQLAGLLSLVAIALVPALTAAPAQAGGQPHRKALPIGSRLYDLGVADIDHDGRLDVFGTAHENAARALLARGNGFRAAPAELGFGTDGNFPGLGNTERKPPEHGRGTYVFVRRVDEGEKDLHLQIDAHSQPAVVDLSLAPSRHVKRVHVHKGSVDANNPGGRSADVQIELAPGGSASLQVNLDLPIGVSSEGPTFVGSKAVPAPGPEFPIRLADAHADVFADLNGDGYDDLLRVVGGLGGGIAKPQIRGKVHDVSRSWGGAAYEDAELGLEKDDCRGRQAAALDIDGDGATDVFESCAGPTKGTAAPPVVEIAKPGGGYDRETVPAKGEVYRWVPAPGGGRPRLLVLGRRATLWDRAGGDWKRLASAALRGQPSQTTLDDFDADGSPDVYVSSLEGSTLLRLSGSSMRAQNPASFGLPDEADAAAWVDADGDGRLDLHSLPGGLFRSSGRNGFHATGQLTSGGRYAHLSWADFDNNGLREPVIARTDGEFTIDAQAWWYGLHPLRRGPAKPFLEVATPGNWLTAKIVVDPSRGPRQIGWAGEAETARYSQGHNRAYFTLPRHSGRVRVSVQTADGSVHRLSTHADRVVSFAR